MRVLLRELSDGAVPGDVSFGAMLLGLEDIEVRESWERQGFVGGAGENGGSGKYDGLAWSTVDHPGFRTFFTQVN